MKILVNGASLSAGPWTWPYRVKEMLNCEMTNIALPAMGNTYIHESTVAELAKNKYDLVLIMWCDSIVRIDWKIDNVDKLEDKNWASQSLAGIKGPYHNDYEAVQKDWISSTGFLVEQYQKRLPREDQTDLNQLFYDYYSVVKKPQLVFHDLIKMISLQGVLKSMNIPYVFMRSGPGVQHVDYTELYASLDNKHFYNEVYIKPLCYINGWMTDEEVPHPTEQGNVEFANHLVTYLKKKNYV